MDLRLFKYSTQELVGHSFKILRYMARNKQGRTHIPALNLPMHSSYSFNDHLRMDG